MYSQLHVLEHTISLPPSFLVPKWRLNARQSLCLDRCEEDERHKDLRLD